MGDFLTALRRKMGIAHRSDLQFRTYLRIMDYRQVVLLTGILYGSIVSAQLSQGGVPNSFTMVTTRMAELPTVQFVEDDGPETLAYLPESDLRYGEQRFRSVDLITQGHWETLLDGSQLCRLVVRSEGAPMISIQFDRWELPEGATVFVYSTDRSTVLGAFDRTNRSPMGTMATQLVAGEASVIEYRVPAGGPLGELRVKSITHAYFDLFGTQAEGSRDLGVESAPCHINTICPEAAAWQDQKRATLLFLRPDGGGCTATLLNNTGTPGIPYVNMAGHCLYTPTLDQTVFYFNYESPTCVGGVGPTTQTMTGASHRADWSPQDMALVELDQAIPASFNAYYAGWDHSGNVPQTVTIIEHPLYDVKKIAFDLNPPTTEIGELGTEMWRVFWDVGMVEGGASGAPCFDQNKRFIGHLTSGSGQTCENIRTNPGGVAKMSAMWEGDYPFYRLHDWLDPANTSVTLDGYDPVATVPAIKVRLKAFLEGPFNVANANMDAGLNNAGLVPLTEPYTSFGYPHVGGGGESTTQPVLNTTGAARVVDWVVIELRNKLNSAQVLATRSALVLRNGNVVSVDGVSDPEFSIPADNYFIALRHRNHLGIMTNAAIALGATASQLDLSNGTIPLFGGTNATKPVGGKAVLWAGDVNGDGTLQYTGLNNDRDLILVRVGGSVATATYNGYSRTDVNMDGIVKYTGISNDRDLILVNIGGAIATATRNASLP